MEEKKKSNGLFIVVVAILCLLIGGIGGYFVSTNFLSKNESNNQNQTTVEDNTQSKCKYEKLKDPSLLTISEKQQIEEKIEYIFPPNSEEIQKVDDYMYLVRFDYQDADAVGSTTTYVTFWKENGVWKHGDYYGSGYEPTPGNSLMCTECGDCN